MLPEIGATELMVIAAVALIVVGPKDLPILLRKLGKIVGRMRAMANEFRASFDEMARQSELDELRKEVEAMRQARYAGAGDFSGVHQTMGEIGEGLRVSPAPAYAMAATTPAIGVDGPEPGDPEWEALADAAEATPPAPEIEAEPVAGPDPETASTLVAPADAEAQR